MLRRTSRSASFVMAAPVIAEQLAILFAFMVIQAQRVEHSEGPRPQIPAKSRSQFPVVEKPFGRTRHRRDVTILDEKSRYIGLDKPPLPVNVIGYSWGCRERSFGQRPAGVRADVHGGGWQDLREPFLVAVAGHDQLV